MGKFTKFHRYAVMEYPVTLKEMEEISKEIPKTERKFYEFAFKALRKVMKEDENIYAFDMANPKLTKTGFIVVGKHNLYLGGNERQIVWGSGSRSSEVCGH
jgi:hypothetical protein